MCVHAARVISSAPYNLVNPKRITIRGGMVRTVRVVLRTRFCAATALYGISDLKPSAEQSHKFESKFRVTLIGDEGDQELYWGEVATLSCRQDCFVIIGAF